MTSPTLYTPGGLPVPGLSKEPNIPLDLAALGEALDPAVELRFTTTNERDGTWPATVAPLGARCFITGTGRRYLRWNAAATPQWFELRGTALTVANVAERDSLTPVAPGMRAYDSSTKRVSEYTGAAWVDLDPRVTARRTAAQVIGTSVLSAMAWQEVTTRSTTGMWSGANGSRLVAQEAGEYDLSAHIPWSASTAGARSISYRVNGGPDTGLVYLDARPANTIYGSETTVMKKGIELNANDYIEINVLQSSGANLSVSAGASATLELIRR